jgi:pseudouridine-5'-phosphate glycosidase
VVGYKTIAFPGFYLTDSGFTIEHQVNSAAEIAKIIHSRELLRTNKSALIVANPVKHEMDRKRHDAILKTGLAGARKAGIIGKAVTPFLLKHFHTASEGESLSVNIEIIKSNSALAADIAVAKQR